MTRQFGCLLLAAALCALTGCGSAARTENRDNETSQAASSAPQTDQEAEEIPSSTQQVFAMDTYMTVTAYGEQAEAAVSAAVEEIQRLDALWSVGESDSEISILNDSGSILLSDETAELVEYSLTIFEETDGAFDITIYPLMVEWGFPSGDYQVPTQQRIDELLELVGSDKLEYDAETRQLTLPEGMAIDLGGIAKGYVSSHIMDVFEEYGVVSGMVSLGGNVQTYRTKTDGSLWRVGIENPDATVEALSGVDYVGILSVADKAVITSGGYERYFEEDGVTYHHILDPATGSSARSGLLSVTIVSEDGTLADGLSTSLFVMGKEKALAFWAEHSDEFDAVLVEEDGAVTITGGLKDCFESDLDYTCVES
ncbi:MAG: FAD:protein FMN transferase [Clostridiales bacterium]|nr:FAD:protein FMN transferase [Clostridiales bacterium]